MSTLPYSDHNSDIEIYKSLAQHREALGCNPGRPLIQLLLDGAFNYKVLCQLQFPPSSDQELMVFWIARSQDSYFGAFIVQFIYYIYGPKVLNW